MPAVDATHAVNGTVTARRAVFGHLPDGRLVEAVTLSHPAGISATITTFGATLHALVTPDRDGTPADIVLGCASLADCAAHASYFGVAVGRYANRIAGGRFSLDGATFDIVRNDGPNTLHGGDIGFDRSLWHILSIEEGVQASVTMALHSPDGDQGFPGNLDVTITYRLDADGALGIEFAASTDAPTIVNLTHHSFFNLGGEASGRTILDHLLTIPANAYTPVDADLIPTGEIRAVAGTPFDFRQPTAIGARIRDADPQLRLAHGYDHTLIVSDGSSDQVRRVATLADPASGRVVEVFSDQPGLQFYSGNFLDGGTLGKGGRLYRQSDGIALEPQLFPDTPNQPAFGSARLDPGAHYRHHILYRFSTLSR